MLTAVFSIFGLAACAPWVHRRLGSFSGWFLCLLPLAVTVYFFTLLPDVAAGEVFTQKLPWAEGLGIYLSFRLDGLSLLFSILISGIGALIIPYASGYLRDHAELGRFYLFFLMFMASMLGVVLSDNLILLFIFWELTSLSSYFLIGFYHEEENSRKSALQALLVTGGGGLAMLAGFVLLGQIAGTWECSALLAKKAAILSHPLFAIVLGLILFGAFTKSAQFPFHFWLPKAMAGPAPVSAYLHSSTMVKAGVYLIARLNPLFGASAVWTFALISFGALTVVTGVWAAFRQSDLKKYLAYMTVSALGLMVMLLGVGSQAAIQAAVVFLLAHAFYKGALFMTAGTVDHATHCRNPEDLGGLWGKMPHTAWISFLAALSMAGLMPFLGFVGKELVLESVLHSASKNVLTAVVVLAGACFATVALIVAIKPFLGKLSASSSKAHEASFSMILGPAILSLAGFAAGLFPFLVQSLMRSASEAILGQSVALKLVLWHGFNTAFFLSLSSLAAAVFLYWKRFFFRRLFSKADFLLILGPERGYDRLLKGLIDFSAFQTRVLQGGRLRVYFRIILSATVILTAGALFIKNGFISGAVRSLQVFDALLIGLVLVSTVAALFARTRLTAIIPMGVIGLVISLVFVRFGAPDLAMTQFAVETLTVILLAFVLYRMPATGAESKLRSKAFDFVISAAFGILMAALTFFGSVATPFLPAVSKYYSEHSLLLAHGRNIVNVIIVDFRGLDTLGEITVLAVAGIGVFSLLKLIIFSEKEEAKS